MADSSIAITGGNVDTRTASNGDHRQVMVVGDSATDNITLVNSEGELYIRNRPADLHVTATAGGTTGATCTVTLPAVAGKFHYITQVAIELMNAAARTGSATPVNVTSTNLPGSPVWAFGSAGAIGVMERYLEDRAVPLKSSVVNTATTIVGTSTTNVLWRIRVSYYTSL